MRLTKIEVGRCHNMLAIPFAVVVEEEDDSVAYVFYLFCFYIGFIYQEVEE